MNSCLIYTMQEYSPLYAYTAGTQTDELYSTDTNDTYLYSQDEKIIIKKTSKTQNQEKKKTLRILLSEHME